MLKSDKQALRRKILSLSEQISEEARATASQKIAEKVIKFIEQKGFLRVFCYVSYRNEVQTHDLLEQLHLNGIEVYVPYIKEKQMWAVLWRPDMPMRENRWGILEPQQIEIAKEIDCALLPGVAFAENGSRLGYGGGYYDRWLKQNHCYTIGLCGSWQLMRSLLVEEHDVFLDAIFSEKQQIFFTSGDNYTKIKRRLPD